MTENSKYATSPYASRRIHHPIFFLCDIQDKFRKAIANYDLLLNTTSKFLRFCEIHTIPIIATTQQRAKLGNTCGELGVNEGGRYAPLVKADVDKSLFSMCTPEILDTLSKLDEAETQGLKHDVVLAGIETHICVTQTTVDLIQKGYRVYVLADAVSSCNAEERGVALARLRQEGARIVTSESLMYEIMHDAGDERFKPLASLVKESKEKTTEAVGTLCRF